MPESKKVIIKLLVDKVHYEYVTLDTMLNNPVERVESFMLFSKDKFIKLDSGRYIRKARVDEFTFSVEDNK